MYIGETSKTLNIRVNEHIDEFDDSEFDNSDNPRTFSAFAQHTRTNGHACDPDNTIFLHSEDSLRKRLALEELEILRHVRIRN